MVQTSEVAIGLVAICSSISKLVDITDLFPMRHHLNFESHRVHCCTWNVGDEKPGNEDLSSFLGVNMKPSPDVISVALQEVSGEDSWRQKLLKHLYPHGYVLIKSRNCWAIWIFAFLKRNLLHAVTNIESEVTASGYGGVMGNKGGVSARFELCGINMIFLSCHFTAHRENKQDRLNDYLDIIDRQSFRDEDVNVIIDHDYVFWMGDLNFRLDNLKKSDVEEMIKEKRFNELLQHDQLLNMKNDNLLFHDFNEGPISFPPTFKFDKGTDIYDNHHLNLPESARQRSVSPSRRLPVRGSPSQVEEKFPANKSIKGRQHPEAVLLKYTSLNEYKTSDHRPVIAVFKLSVPPRWFSLPVKFVEPDGKAYPCDTSLEISYQILDPPGLLRLSETNSLLSSKEYTPVSDFAKLLLLNALGHSTNSGKSGKTDDDLGPLAPPTLQTTSFDWIALYPDEFADLEKDYITYVYASSNVTQTKHRKNSVSSALLQPPKNAKFQEFYKSKIEACRLKDLAGQSFCLVYMSRNKHCPQGYSLPFKVSFK
ncbi:Phosphatidylinositol 4,5-bisphosphate 5-phosphatase A [Schistosoma japonicum]|nr:Phosphatidylinositol 4,5-bisphosphate 5-phosphatase A [Schistosoma japonicum]